ncbi:MAG: histidine ammonia-lyase [Acidobacteriota bacterium]
MTQSGLELDGCSLTLEAVEAASRGGVRVALSPAARVRMRESRAVVERILSEGTVVYGINTGFGALASTRVPPDQLDQLQRNLILSHCVGVGAAFDPPTTRAMLLLRANTLARGLSGIRPEVVEALLELLNRDLLPRVPRKGSVGASGDLAPLAHLAAPLIGEGLLRYGRDLRPAAEVLAENGLERVRLAPREGLALINGTAVMTAQGVLALQRAWNVARHADLATAMAVEGLQGTVRAFDPRIHAARGQRGQIRSAAVLRALLADSEIMESHRNCGKVQDSYALRCAPQVHGAVRDSLEHIGRVLAVEINAATDNPLVFPDEGESLSGGNFHGAPVGHVLDLLAIAMADLASISERRLNRLVNPHLSGLPAFLVPENPGLNSGFMMVQVTAAALTSENKVLASPASVDSIPTSADVEDHVSMGTHAARKAMEVVENTETVVALEMLAAAQALDLEAPLRPARAVGAVHERIRRDIAGLTADRMMGDDIERMQELVRRGELLRAAESVTGPLE